MVKTFLNLGKQPLANGLLTAETDEEFFFDLKVQFDEESFLVSLVDFVKPELMFNSNYPYYSSCSQSTKKHFQEIAKEIQWLNPPGEPIKILEIGSNDGVFISNFFPSSSVCVEPCSNFAEITRKMGYVTYDEFWNLDLAQRIVKKHGQMDVVYSANCMCHIQNLEETFSAITEILSDDGYFIFEDPSLLDVIKNDAFDQFYDEHSYIFSIIALDNLVKEFGLYIDDVEHLNTHGGSNRVTVRKIRKDKYSQVEQALDLEYGYKLDKLYTYENFANRVEHNKLLLKNIFNGISFSGYGATSKSTVVYNYCGIKPDFVTDTTEFKQGKLMPGIHSPILSSETPHKEFIFLGAWNYKDEILIKEKNRSYKFITHIPKVSII